MSTHHVDIIECLCCMAALTALPESSHMHIIILMALITGAWQVHLAVDRAAVTGIAVGFFMRAIELEIGLLVMIETPDLP